MGFIIFNLCQRSRGIEFRRNLIYLRLHPVFKRISSWGQDAGVGQFHNPKRGIDGVSRWTDDIRIRDRKIR